MIICEAALMTVLTVLGIYASVGDIKKGIIDNKALVVASVIALVVDCFYYSCFVPDYTMAFMINNVLIAVFSVALYYYSFWAAGDSKLLICMSLLVPARIYGEKGYSYGFKAIIYIFLYALLFLLLDTIICIIKKEKFFSRKSDGSLGMVESLKTFAISFMYLNVINVVFRLMFERFFFENRVIFGFVSLFIAMYIHRIAFFRKWFVVVGGIAGNILALLYGFGMKGTDYMYVIILFAVLVLRYVINGYNYKEIRIEEVKPGQIISYATIIRFLSSRVSGLPLSTSEDIRSKISKDQVDAIKRWSKSKYGADTIIIVF